MKNWLLKACFAAVVSVSLPAQAALIKTGDVALDTSTGLEWLSVRLPNGLSYQQVQSGIGGWTLNGWRLANFEELSSLANRYVGAANGGYSSAAQSALSTEYAASADVFVQVLGMNLAFNDPRALYNLREYPGLRQISVQGMFLDRSSADPRLGLFETTAVLEDAAGIYGSPDRFVPFGRWGLFENFIEPTRSGPNLSSFLVRESAQTVPEPSTLLLGMLALLSLSMMGRMRFRRNR